MSHEARFTSAEAFPCSSCFAIIGLTTLVCLMLVSFLLMAFYKLARLLAKPVMNTEKLELKCNNRMSRHKDKGDRRPNLLIFYTSSRKFQEWDCSKQQNLLKILTVSFWTKCLSKTNIRLIIAGYLYHLKSSLVYHLTVNRHVLYLSILWPPNENISEELLVHLVFPDTEQWLDFRNKKVSSKLGYNISVWSLYVLLMHA